MKKDTKETSPEQRVVVIEKGKAIDESPQWLVCCLVSLFPIRG